MQIKHMDKYLTNYTAKKMASTDATRHQVNQVHRVLMAAVIRCASMGRDFWYRPSHQNAHIGEAPGELTPRNNASRTSVPSIKP
jgi:hypothetical protein